MSAIRSLDSLKPHSGDPAMRRLFSFAFRFRPVAAALAALALLAGALRADDCPSRGIGLTPDEKEVWVCDAANRRMHAFDDTTMPPKRIASVKLREEPGWITFSLDGRHAWPST